MNIFIDSNVWNFLFDNNLWLPDIFASDTYNLFVTRELDFELAAIPEEKSDLKEYIKKTFEASNIRVDTIFGFNDETLPDTEQRVGGFNFGRFICEKESKFESKLHHHLKKNKKLKSKLYRNEGDASLAMRSVNYIVLTLDFKKGPLQDAKKLGGKIIFLNYYNPESSTFKEYLLSEIEQYSKDSITVESEGSV